MNGYSKSQKGATQLVHDGYTYQENYTYKETTNGAVIGKVRVYWKCAHAKCKGTARTYRAADLEDCDFINGQDHSVEFQFHKAPKTLFKEWNHDGKMKMDVSMKTEANTSSSSSLAALALDNDLDGLTHCSDLPSDFFCSSLTDDDNFSLMTNEETVVFSKRKREDEEREEIERVRKELNWYKEMSKVAGQQMEALQKTLGATKMAELIESNEEAKKVMGDLSQTVAVLKGRVKSQVARKLRVAVKKVLAAKRFSVLRKSKDNGSVKSAEITITDDFLMSDEKDLDGLILSLLDGLDDDFQ